jgi:hypothetical protein
MLGGTGIAEVALPESFRARTAQDTERAKVEFLQRKMAKIATSVAMSGGLAMDGSGTAVADAALLASAVGPVDAADTLAIPAPSRREEAGGAGTGSFTANYSHHRREYAMFMQQQSRGHGQGQRDGQAPRAPRPQGSGLGAVAGAAFAQGGQSQQAPTGQRRFQGQHQHQHGQKQQRASDDALFNSFKRREINSMRNR